MGIEFNADEILETAERMERNGAEFYRLAAEGDIGSGSKQKLLELAEMEAAHEKAFAALRAKRKLPPPQQFLDELFDRLDTKESTLAEWCRGEGIAFVSLTLPLRRAAAEGKQVFYTYDDHWTLVGHDVVAEAIHDYWKARTRRATVDLEQPLAQEPTGTARATTND